MKAYESRFYTMLLLVLLAIGCSKDQTITIPELSPATRDLIGHWENINAYTDGLQRIVITIQEPGQLSIHFWRACPPGACYLGVRTRDLKGIRNGRLSTSIQWENKPLSWSRSTERYTPYSTWNRQLETGLFIQLSFI